jgi:hypothetical protein
MLTYDDLAGQLRATLTPLSRYCADERGRIDPAEPKHQFRFRHVQQLEAATKATINYFKAADAVINPLTDWPLAYVQQVIANLQPRLDLSAADRAALASITSHNLHKPNTTNQQP